MKVLITGIAGFIGSHCAERLLENGYNVTGIDNFSEYYNVILKYENATVVKNKGGNILKLDLRDKNALNNLSADYNYIFHFAAQPGISNTSTFEDYFSNNIIGTQNVIDFALRCKELKLFVNIGTSSIYGLEAIFSENKMPRPASFYGVTKLVAEQLVLQKSREKKIKACSLRLFSVIGPRERPEKMYSKLIDLGLKNKPFPLFEGSEKHLRSFTYIGDIIDGIVSVFGNESKVDGEIINLGTEKEHTTQEGIDAVEKIIGKSITIEIHPKIIGDQLRTKAIIDKARRLLDFDPKTTLLQSLKAQIAWYKDK